MKLLLFPFLVFFIAAATFADGVRAGYSDGLEAMQRGDYAAALEEFESLAAQGHREAQFSLAFMYDFGQGTDPDPDRALTWYRAAAEQGLEEAQLTLALMYADGRGVPQDLDEAIVWYRRAALQGNALAQNDLGDIFRQGKGVPPDFIEAFVWYDAAAQGLPTGETRDAVIASRDAAAAQLDEAALAEAKERAAAFRAQTELPPPQQSASRDTAEADEPEEVAAAAPESEPVTAPVPDTSDEQAVTAIEPDSPTEGIQEPEIETTPETAEDPVPETAEATPVPEAQEPLTNIEQQTAAIPSFDETLRKLLSDESQDTTAVQETATDPAVQPPNPTVELIDERVESLEAIVERIDTVGAAGLGWNLLEEWESTAVAGFRKEANDAVAEEVRGELKSTRQSQIVLGDPYGNFLRVTEAYLTYLETLRTRYQ